MLALRTSSAAGTASAPRRASRVAVVRCSASVDRRIFGAAAAAVTAAGVLLAPPVFASLPEGVSSPQGTDTLAVEEALDSLIEQRTGKADALPELNDVPQGEFRVKTTYDVKPLASGLDRKALQQEQGPAPALPAAPLAPAVTEPPPPPAAAPQIAEPRAGLQSRGAASAQAAAAGGSNGLLIGGGVAVLGAVAAVALGGNSGEVQAAAPAAAAPAAPEPVPAPAGEPAAPAAAEGAAVEGGAPLN